MQPLSVLCRNSPGLTEEGKVCRAEQFGSQYLLNQPLVLFVRALCTVLPFLLPAKEIQLMHRAPVVGIVVLDGQSVPLPEPLEVAHDLSKSPNMQGSHQLLVVSEEQFKVTVRCLSLAHSCSLPLSFSELSSYLS